MGTHKSPVFWEQRGQEGAYFLMIGDAHYTHTHTHTINLHAKFAKMTVSQRSKMSHTQSDSHKHPTHPLPHTSDHCHSTTGTSTGHMRNRSTHPVLTLDWKLNAFRRSTQSLSQPLCVGQAAVTISWPPANTQAQTPTRMHWHTSHSQTQEQFTFAHNINTKNPHMDAWGGVRLQR